MSMRPVCRLKHTFLCNFKRIQTKQCKFFVLAWCTSACSTCLLVKATNFKLIKRLLHNRWEVYKWHMEEILGPGTSCPKEQYHTSHSSVGNSEMVPLLSGEGAYTVLCNTSPLGSMSSVQVGHGTAKQPSLGGRASSTYSLSCSMSWLISGEDEIRDYIYSPCPVISFYRSHRLGPASLAWILETSKQRRA